MKGRVIFEMVLIVAMVVLVALMHYKDLGVVMLYAIGAGAIVCLVLAVIDIVKLEKERRNIK